MHTEELTRLVCRVDVGTRLRNGEEGVRGADFIYARSWRSLKCYDDPDRELLLKRSLNRWMLTSEILALGAPGAATRAA